MADVVKRVAGECPDLETIAACLDGRLSDRERARITEHLAACEDCYTVFHESAQTHVVGEPTRPHRAERWRAWVTVPRLAWSSAGAALVTAAVVWLAVGSSLFMSRRPADAELQALVAAVGADRTIEPRLIGGFAFGLLRGVVRSATAIDVVSPDVRIAAARIEKAATERPTPQHLRALGAAYLVVGQFDNAVNVLEKARQQAPGDATVLSDLSAAYLARGKNAGEAEDFARAASQAERATKTNALLPEALFNRALAFEALSLQREARESWEHYLQLDSRSPWAEEARRHLQILSEQSDAWGRDPVTALRDAHACRQPDRSAQIVKASPSRSREFFDDELLPLWADAYLAGDHTQAAQWFGCAESLADAFADGGEMMARDTVDTIGRASGLPDAHATLFELATAHAAFRAARHLYEQNRFNEAESQFRGVSARLLAAGSEVWVGAAFYAESSAYYQQRVHEVNAALPALIDVATAHRYVSLAGRLHSLKGVIEVNQSALAASLGLLRRADLLRAVRRPGQGRGCAQPDRREPPGAG